MLETHPTAKLNLTVRRTFKAPRGRVFDAFTDAALMKRWMGGPESECSAVSFDPREGGAYRIVFKSPANGEVVVKGVVTSLRRPDHLAYTWRWEEDDPADEFDTLVHIDFVERGAETEVILMHEGFANEASRDRHDAGWTGSLIKVDALF